MTDTGELGEWGINQSIKKYNDKMTFEVTIKPLPFNGTYNIPQGKEEKLQCIYMLCSIYYGSQNTSVDSWFQRTL